MRGDALSESCVVLKPPLPPPRSFALHLGHMGSMLGSSWVGVGTHLEIREVLCHEIVDFADGKASGLAVL